jgi:hypothetical protein
VKLKKFLTLSLILTFVFSISLLAKDAFSFEPEEYPDSLAPTYMDPFFTSYRDSRPEDFTIAQGEKAWYGNHSVRISMTHEGTSWIILAKNYYLGMDNPEHLDSTFMIDLDNGDTIYYYLYVPWNAPIDSIFIFVRDADWSHDEHTVYHASDLCYGRWNELKDGISELTTNGDEFSTENGDSAIIQIDFQIDLIADSIPACTLYWDCPSSKGRVPPAYTDTAGQAGIEMQESGEGPLKITKASINCVEYKINSSAPVMIQVFDLTGRKQKEMPIGLQPAGTYSIPLNLAPGVYITKVTTDVAEATGKIICVK